jgi:DNA-binding transcriptional ArsR family regulator
VTASPATRWSLAHFGELVGDPSRVAMLLSLMDGESRPASELAAIAGVTPPTASFHLGRLVAGGLVRVEPQGRHRFYAIASGEVADALEAVASLHPAPVVPMSPERRALAHARTCYQHLAGRLGVAWLSALERARFLRVDDGAIALTRRGIGWCSDAGLAPARWPTGKLCLDWTERKNHLGGPLGALLTQHLFERRWIARRREARAVRVTVQGQQALRKLGVDLAS